VICHRVRATLCATSKLKNVERRYYDHMFGVGTACQETLKSEGARERVEERQRGGTESKRPSRALSSQQCI
jgi:hypothetical protein